MAVDSGGGLGIARWDMTDERTDRRARDAFLGALRECGNVTEAAAAAGIGRSTVYEWRDADEVFAADWKAAVALGIEGLEDEARRRAYRGYDKPVYQQGVCVGYVREYSDTLMTLLLKGGKPEVYRERVSAELTGRDGGPLQISYDRFVHLSPEKLEAIEELIESEDEAHE